VKETDAIFENLTEVHRREARSEGTLRLSCDAKAPVLIGPFSRGGKSRRGTRGADHDFKPWGKLTPFDVTDRRRAQSGSIFGVTPREVV